MNETQVNNEVVEKQGAASKEGKLELVVGKNLFEKLLEVRKRVPYLQKGAGSQYNYVGSSQVLGALRDELDKQKLLLFPHVKNKKIHILHNEAKHRNSFFTEIDIDFEWVDAESGESKTIPFYAQGIDIEGEKGVGKALTYAEKYFLLKQFNIPTDNLDPDTFANVADSNTKNYITDAQITELSDFVLKIATYNNTSGDTIIQSLGVQSLAKLEVGQFMQAKQYLIGWLQNLEQNSQPQQVQQQVQNVVSQEQLPFPDVPVSGQNQQYFEQSNQQNTFEQAQPQQTMPNENVLRGQLTFVTPVQQVMGEPQIALMLVDEQNNPYNVLVRGLREVQTFETIQVGQVVTIGYVNDGGVPLFTSLK